MELKWATKHLFADTVLFEYVLFLRLLRGNATFSLTCDDTALWARCRVVPVRVDTIVVENIAATFQTVSAETFRLGVELTVGTDPVDSPGVTHRVRVLSTSGSDCY